MLWCSLLSYITDSVIGGRDLLVAASFLCKRVAMASTYESNSSEEEEEYGGAVGGFMYEPEYTDAELAGMETQLPPESTERARLGNTTW